MGEENKSWYLPFNETSGCKNAKVEEEEDEEDEEEEVLITRGWGGSAAQPLGLLVHLIKSWRIQKL